MDPNFTPEQKALKGAVRRFCDEQITVDRLARWQADERGIDVAVWRSIAEQGWFGLGVPVEMGGSGLGLVEVACLLQECARGLVPHCVSNAIRSAWALAELDPDAPELRVLASGQKTATLAFDEEGGSRPEHYETQVLREGGAPLLYGAKSYVSEGVAADYQIVSAVEGRGICVALVEATDTEREPLRSFDGDRQALVRYARTPLLRVLVHSDEGASRLAALEGQLAALALAEMLGCMEAALDLTVAYVKEREQFGQKIAVFQAVQHQVADMATAFTASRHLAWQAICRLAAGTAAGDELDHARVFVGQACKRVTLTAHHLHGGAGYVLEHPLHHYAERALSLCIRHAPEKPALASIAARLLD